MATIFLSYSTKDRALVEELRRMLATALHATGYEIFHDVRSIAGGDDWEEALYAAIDRSEVVLACLSSRYYASRWCSIERERAVAAGATIVPVLLCDVADNHLLAHLQVRHAGGRPLASFEGPGELDAGCRKVVDQVARDLKQVPPSLRGSRSAWRALARVTGKTPAEARALLAERGDDIGDELQGDDAKERLRVAFDVASGLMEGWAVPHFRVAVAAALASQPFSAPRAFASDTPPYWDAVVDALVTMADTCSDDPRRAFEPLASALVHAFGGSLALERIRPYASEAAALWAPPIVDVWANGDRVRTVDFRRGRTRSAVRIRNDQLDHGLEAARRHAAQALGTDAGARVPALLRLVAPGEQATRPLADRSPATWENTSGERAADLFDVVAVWPRLQGLAVTGAPTPSPVPATACVLGTRQDTRATRLARAGHAVTAFARPAWDQGPSPAAMTHKDTALSVLLPEPDETGVRARLFPGGADRPLPDLFALVGDGQRAGEDVHVLWTDAASAVEEDETHPLEDS